MDSSRSKKSHRPTYSTSYKRRSGRNLVRSPNIDSQIWYQKSCARTNKSAEKKFDDLFKKTENIFDSPLEASELSNSSYDIFANSLEISTVARHDTSSSSDKRSDNILQIDDMKFCEEQEQSSKGETHSLENDMSSLTVCESTSGKPSIVLDERRDREISAIPKNIFEKQLCSINSSPDCKDTQCDVSSHAASMLGNSLFQDNSPSNFSAFSPISGVRIPLEKKRVTFSLRCFSRMTNKRNESAFFNEHEESDVGQNYHNITLKNVTVRKHKFFGREKKGTLRSETVLEEDEALQEPLKSVSSQECCDEEDEEERCENIDEYIENILETYEKSMCIEEIGGNPVERIFTVCQQAEPLLFHTVYPDSSCTWDPTL